MSIITAESLRSELQAVLDETGPAIAAADAIPTMRREVERLREITRTGTDAEADKAATKLVSATRLLQEAEIVEERKNAAKHNAISKRAAAGLSALRRIESHFGALCDEACSLAHQIATSLVSPAAMEIRADQNRLGVVRDSVVGQYPGFAIGCYEAFQLRQQAHSAQLFDARTAAVPNAQTLIDLFDASTASITAQVERLRSILAAVGSSAVEAASTGGVVPCSSGATADEAEELATV